MILAFIVYYSLLPLMRLARVNSIIMTVHDITRHPDAKMEA